MPVVWRKEEGEGNAMTHLHRQTVTMLAIVTVWTTWHVATSSPAHSIVWCANGGGVALPPHFRRGWCLLLPLWAASDGRGRWQRLATGGDVARPDDGGGGWWQWLAMVATWRARLLSMMVVVGGGSGWRRW